MLAVLATGALTFYAGSAGFDFARHSFDYLGAAFAVVLTCTAFGYRWACNILENRSSADWI